MIENLTEKALMYSLIGATLRVYAWTVFSVVLFLLFKAFEKISKSQNLKLRFHYLFLLCIPLALINAAIYSIEVETTSGIFVIDLLIFILGLIFLITTLLIHNFFRKQRSKSYA